MVNLFNFATNDQSLVYLAKIFGYMNEIIPVTGVSPVTTTDATTGAVTTLSGTVSGAVGTSITLLGTMFKTFNATVLSVAVLIVVYTMVVGIMATAHEGEFMGKKWHSLWVPIRTVFGIACLVPTASGYCILQMIMMWVIVQGIGAADTLWTTVLNYVDIAGSPYAQVSLPSLQYQNSLNQLFQGLVCQTSASIRSNQKGNSEGGSSYCDDADNSSSTFCRRTSTAVDVNGNINPSATSYYSYGGSGTVTPKSTSDIPMKLPLGPSGDCGILSYCNSSSGAACADSTSLSCTSCQAEQAALQQIFPVLQNIANLYVQADLSYSRYALLSGLSLPQTVKTTSASGVTTTTTLPPMLPRAPPIPQAVQQYCTEHGINPCQRDFNGNSGLPDPQWSQGSPSRNAVKDLYWTYYIKPQLGTSIDFMGIVSKDMSDALDKLFEDFNKKMTDALKANGSNLTGDLADAQDLGWIMAGSYYYTIAQMNQNNLKDAMPELSIAFNNSDNIAPNATDSNVMYNYRNNYSGAAVLIGAGAGAGSSMGGALPTSVDQISQISSYVGSSVSSTTEGSLSGDSNPLVQAQTAGYALLMIVQIAYPIFIVILFSLSLVGNVSPFVLGTGITNPLGPALLAVYLIVVPALLAFFGILMAIGATLSVYLPLVPFVIFTFGAIGWLTSTIEAMVAGPLVALGVIAPGGHHEILGKAEPALMLLFNVFLRPSLMIFGLVAAMLLASVVIGMINGAFWRVMTSISGGGSAGTAAVVLSPLTMVFFLAAYMSLVVSAMNKCFAAIHIIPEKVMRWIGGQGEQYGEGEALSEMKQGVSGAASKAGQGASHVGGVAKSKHEAAAAQKKNESKENAAKVSGGGEGSAPPSSSSEEKKP